MEKDRSSRIQSAVMLKLGWASAVFLMLLAAYAIYQVTFDMFNHMEEELALTQVTPMAF